MNGKNYYLGLDMGTSSVGWAVTTPDYELVRAKGKDLWGVRLFDEAETAAGRRQYRTARRRRQREIATKGFLKSVFADEIEKIDEGFFVRLEESKFYLDEKSNENKQPYALFAGTDYTDKEYYKEYPTVFHLRKALLENDEGRAFDVRLVYLAISSLYKRRGHFLNDMIDEESREVTFSELYEDLRLQLMDMEICELPIVDCKKLEGCLSERGLSKSKILENTMKIVGITKKNKKEYQVFSLICGLTTKIKDLFGEEILGEENKTISICFRNASYEERAAEVQELLGNDNFSVV